MKEEAPAGRRHGTVAVLALLLSVLVSAANVPAAARTGTDGRSSAIGQAEKGKGAALLRAAGRHAAGEQEGEDFTSPPGARVESRAGALRPLPQFHGALPAPRVAAAGFDYRARAPPAAA